MMIEQWKSLAFLGISNYEISNLGRIKNITSNRYLTGFNNANGYIQVTLKADDGRTYAKKRSRLVALAFIPNKENKPQVDHIDGNRTNDVVTNLRWVTASENMLNPVTRKNNSESHKGKPVSDDTKQKLKAFWETISEEQRDEISKKISKARKGKPSHAKGRHRCKDDNGKWYYV